MRPILALAAKDLTLLMRRPAHLFFTVAWPLIVALVFGMIFGGPSERRARLNVVVADDDRSEASAALVQRLGAQEGVEISTATIEESRDLVRRGQRVAYVHVPRRIRRGERADLLRRAGPARDRTGSQPPGRRRDARRTAHRRRDAEPRSCAGRSRAQPAARDPGAQRPAARSCDGAGEQRPAPLPDRCRSVPAEPATRCRRARPLWRQGLAAGRDRNAGGASGRHRAAKRFRGVVPAGGDLGADWRRVRIRHVAGDRADARNADSPARWPRSPPGRCWPARRWRRS